eukprot:TRINITY_DN16918_c0_g1::TRINITY_DN16918_c0_g1_i1::g.29581::m.29581 TRINITY_DN16918_c0_g1::TRINITY_DN16918_c0_g1_i1::g.29581  ORF type:complete len:132 (-),score=1.37,sp/Q9M9M6/NDUS6_ARATH/54.41/1e-15,zf-CHCC/PF10276.4/8.9e-16,COX5B/PF01215.14/0.035,PolC_DP2/PF03833.8/0.14 TRINITY_DN16918_c0_g1_i1:62-415(-)
MSRIQRLCSLRLACFRTHYATHNLRITRPYAIAVGEPQHNERMKELARTKWRSNAMDLIDDVAPIEVEDRVVACNGGGGALGHPIEFIKLDRPNPEPCKYCGLRYVRKHGHGHGEHH